MKHIILEVLDFAGGLPPSSTSLGEVLFAWWIFSCNSPPGGEVVFLYSYVC